MSTTLFASLFLALNFFPVESTSILLQQGRNTIEGRITTSDNRPVDNVRVFLTAEGPLAQTITDGSGRYQFRRIRRGIYYVEVEPGGTGLARQTQRVEVNQPDLAGTGGADFYRADFVLKPDRSGKSDRDDALKRASGTLFYQDVPQPARDAYKQGTQSLRRTSFGKLRSLSSRPFRFSLTTTTRSRRWVPCTSSMLNTMRGFLCWAMRLR